MKCERLDGECACIPRNQTSLTEITDHFNRSWSVKRSLKVTDNATEGSLQSI